MALNAPIASMVLGDETWERPRPQFSTRVHGTGTGTANGAGSGTSNGAGAAAGAGCDGGSADMMEVEAEGSAEAAAAGSSAERVSVPQTSNGLLMPGLGDPPPDKRARRAPPRFFEIDNPSEALAALEMEMAEAQVWNWALRQCEV